MFLPNWTYGHVLGEYSPGAPGNFSLGALDAPLSTPVRLRTSTYPASAIADHRTIFEQNGGISGRWIDVAAPARVPGVATDRDCLLTKHSTYEIEMVNAHIDQ